MIYTHTNIDIYNFKNPFYEGKHAAFVFLHLPFSLNKCFQFHSPSCKCCAPTFLHGCIKSYCLYIPHIHYPFICSWHLGWLHIYFEWYLCFVDLESFGYTVRSGIAGPYRGSIFVFGRSPTLTCIVAAPFIPSSLLYKSPSFPTPLPPSSLVFLMVNVMKYNTESQSSFIWIFLMAKDVDHFKNLLVICISFFENFLFGSFAHLMIGSF